MVLRQKVMYCFEYTRPTRNLVLVIGIRHFVKESNREFSGRKKIAFFDPWTRRRLDLTDQISSGEWTYMNLRIFVLAILLDIDHPRRTGFDEINHILFSWIDGNVWVIRF